MMIAGKGGNVDTKNYRAVFNQVAKEIGEKFEWREDLNNPGFVDDNEIWVDPKALSNYDLKPDNIRAGWVITPPLKLLAQIGGVRAQVETKRRDAIQKQLARTTVVDIDSNLDHYKLNAEQKKMVNEILKAGRLMEELFQAQQGALPYKNRVNMNGTEDDKEFYNRYQTVWCEDKTDLYCNALSSLPAWSTPLYPEGIDCEKDNITEALANPFSAIVRNNGKLETVPYAEVHELKFLQANAATQLNTAAKAALDAKEPELANYMSEVAGAFLSKNPYPYLKADEAWIKAKTSRFFLRIGADEYQHDYTCGARAQYHMVFGIKDPSASKIIDAIMQNKQVLGDYLAGLIPGFKPIPISIETPEFMDVLMDSGDAVGSPLGTAVGQTLPNWCGEDGKGECSHRIMSYSNKTEKAYSQALQDALKEIMSPELAAALDIKKIADKIVLHELSHNMGPQNQEANATFGENAGKLEEAKAEIGAMALLPKLEKLGLADPKNRNGAYAALLAWCLGHIRRGAPRGEKYYESPSPYVNLAAVTVGYLTERGALTYADGKWAPNFSKMPEAFDHLYAELGKIYIGKSSKDLDAFFKRYTSGKGLSHLHLDRINETIAKVPSTIFRYSVEGAELTQSEIKIPAKDQFCP